MGTSETSEELSEGFALVHVPEGARSPGCSTPGCGCGKGEVFYFFLLDRSLRAMVPFESREEALNHLAGLGPK